MELDYDVIIIGGGFGGIFHLHHLRKLGFRAHLFEAGAKLGGIWYWNCKNTHKQNAHQPETGV